MGGLLVWLWTVLAPVPGVATCFVPEGPVVARVAWGGGEVVAREGALVVGARAITTCDGLPDPYPSALATDGERLWVGFRAAGVFAFENGTFRRIEGLPPDGVIALAAQGGGLWVGLGRLGLWRVEGGPAKPFRHRILGAQGITALHAAGDTLEVGVGPYGWWSVAGRRATRRAKGVFAGCFDAAGQPRAPGPRCALGSAAPASGLPSGHVTALEVHENALYVGTFDGGLARWDGARFVALREAPRFINALLSWQGTLWIATPRGLFRLDPGGRVRPMPLPLPSTHLNGLAGGPDGTLWIATSQGLAGLSATGLRTLDRRHGLPGRIVYAVAVAADGAIWAGTEAGAARVGPQGVQVFDQARGTLPHDWVNALLPDGDGVLAGTYDAGVVRLAPTGQATAVPTLAGTWINPAGLVRVGDQVVAATLGDGLRFAAEGLGPQPGLPSADVTAARLHGGALWVGTRGGLVRLAAPAHVLGARPADQPAPPRVRGPQPRVPGRFPQAT